MHELPNFSSRRATLSPPQRRRLACIRKTLAAARITDLAALGPAELIELVERLRARLDDSVLMLDETTEEDSAAPEPMC